jgi:hypothetical protein
MIASGRPVLIRALTSGGMLAAGSQSPRGTGMLMNGGIRLRTSGGGLLSSHLLKLLRHLLMIRHLLTHQHLLRLLLKILRHLLMLRRLLMLLLRHLVAILAWCRMCASRKPPL